MKKKILNIVNNKIEITLILFKNVMNAKEIVERYNANITETVNVNNFYLLLDAQLILNEDHIIHSVYRAEYNFAFNKIITKNIILEILFLLSYQDNINECLNEYQIKKDSSSIIYVGINITNEEIDSFIKSVQGMKVSFNELSYLHDKNKIMNNFRCTEINNLEKLIFHNIASKKIENNLLSY